MNRSLSLLLLVSGTALFSCASADFASAQPMSPQPSPGAIVAPPAATLSASDLQQLPETRGTIQIFTLTPRGDLDGFLLADGTQVHVPPHLSTQLAATVRPGDQVAVRGYRSAAVPLIVAVAVTNSTTNQMVTDRGPPPPGFGPPPSPPSVPAPGAQQTSLDGRVQTPLYGPAGDLNGAVLEDGAIIRLPPPMAAQSANLLARGQTIAVQGWVLSTAYGRVIDAQTFGPAPTPTTTVAPPPPPAGSIVPPAYPTGTGSPPRPPGL
jgi:hypothetical protein